MSILKRYIISSPGAFITTVGLALVMTSLIKIPFISMQKSDELFDFSINVARPILEPFTKKKEPPKLKTVVPPPPRPVLSFDNTQRPTQTVVVLTHKPVDIKKPNLAMNPISVSGMVHSGPTIRMPPAMPIRADRSGHCDMVFDVNSKGAPYNISTQSCSQSLFARASVKAVRKWKYTPHMEHGQATGRTRLKAVITFNLMDEHGRIIPE